MIQSEKILFYFYLDFYGVPAFCFILGMVLLTLSLTVLKKKNNLQKYRHLQIAFIITGVISLLIVAFRIVLFLFTLQLFS